MSHTELKPCPFCGSAPTSARMSDMVDNFDHYFSISCGECGFEITDEYASGVQTTWNRRASLAAKDARIEKLEKALKTIFESNQIREFMGDDVNDGYGNQGWVTRDGQYAKVARAALTNEEA